MLTFTKKMRNNVTIVCVRAGCGVRVYSFVGCLPAVWVCRCAGNSSYIVVLIYNTSVFVFQHLGGLICFYSQLPRAQKWWCDVLLFTIG